MRADYEGRGLCRYLEDLVMRRAAARGHTHPHQHQRRRSDARVVAQPPPFRATVVKEMWADEMEAPMPPTDEARKVFPHSHVMIKSLWAELTPQQ